MVILGEAALSDIDLIYAKFADAFEDRYISQGYTTDRDIEETLDIGWELLSILRERTTNVSMTNNLDKYYKRLQTKSVIQYVVTAAGAHKE